MSEKSSESVLTVAEAIACQSGGIVSRVIMKGKNGNVTLFAFDGGQELSEHTAPFDALVNVLEGAVTVTIGGVPHRLAAGSMVVMPANVPHALRAEERMKMMLVMIKG